MEEDLLRLSRFVDFAGNDSTYSIEIARVLMAACAEVDVVLKEICRAEQPDSRASSINDYWPIVTAAHRIRDLQVTIHRYGLSLRPWSEWDEGSPPLWWTANNKVKHERAQRFAEANLKNCLNAVAGLFAAVLYLYRERAEGGGLNPPAALLGVPEVWRGSPGMEPQALAAYYKLP